MHNPIRTTAALAALSAAALAAAPATGAVVQDPGANYIAFEAENFDISSTEIVNGTPTMWAVVADGDADGGAALTHQGAFVTNPDNDVFVGYDLTFVTGGTYQLYVRREANSGGSNSFFVGASNSGVTDPTAAAGFSQFDNVLGSPTFPFGQYIYIGNDETDAGQADAYTLDVTAGETLTFYAKAREVGYLLDRIVLSTEEDLSMAQLAALPNSGIPEPATASLLAVAAGLGLRRRR